MFRFFKGFFSKQTSEEEIMLSNVDEWFDSKIKENLDLYDELDSIYAKIDDEIRKLQTSLSILQKADIKNKNISERALQLMEGNRESYIKKVNDFIKQINPPEKNSLINLKEFTERLSVLMNDLNDSTVKQYYILQEFFANEAKDVAISIKKIDELKDEIVRLIDKDRGFSYIHDVHSKIKNVEQKLIEEEKLKEKIDELDAKLKEAKAQKEKIETDIDNLETSPQFQAHSENQSTKLKIEAELRRHKENFSLFFSPIEKALAKYQRIAFESDKEVLNDYIRSPVEALENDKTLKILNILKNVAYKLNEIEPDEKKKERILSAINKFNEVYIKDFLWKYGAIKNKLIEINRRLSINTINNEINDLNYKLKHSEEQIAKIESEIEKLKSKLNSLNVKEDINELQEQLNKLAPVKIKC